MNQPPAGRCVYCTQLTTSRLTVERKHVVKGKDGIRSIGLDRDVPCCGACQAARANSNPGLEAEKNKARGRLWARRQTSLI